MTNSLPGYAPSEQKLIVHALRALAQRWGGYRVGDDAATLADRIESDEVPGSRARSLRYGLTTPTIVPGQTSGPWLRFDRPNGRKDGNE